MKCPYQTISITEKVIAYAVGNNDFIKTTVSFQECLKYECPCYIPERKIGNAYLTEGCSRERKEGDEK